MNRTTVTADYITNRLTKVTYLRIPDTTVTVCCLFLANGFSVRGESACVDPANFDEQLGRNLAYTDAFNKLWSLEGYLLAEERYRERRGDVNALESEQDKQRYELLEAIRVLLGVSTFEWIIPQIRSLFGCVEGLDAAGFPSFAGSLEVQPAMPDKNPVANSDIVC